MQEHNPLYANITIPSYPINVLPEDELNLSQDTDINDAKAGTQATEDLVDESGVESCKSGIDVKQDLHNSDLSDSEGSLPEFNLDGSARICQDLKKEEGAFQVVITYLLQMEKENS